MAIRRNPWGSPPCFTWYSRRGWTGGTSVHRNPRDSPHYPSLYIGIGCMVYMGIHGAVPTRYMVQDTCRIGWTGGVAMNNVRGNAQDSPHYPTLYSGIRYKVYMGIHGAVPPILHGTWTGGMATWDSMEQFPLSYVVQWDRVPMYTIHIVYMGIDRTVPHPT